jgi:tRNA-Thr(GGU) m(6)t(6)A37 methyltransferase TsaA
MLGGLATHHVAAAGAEGEEHYCMNPIGTVQRGSGKTELALDRQYAPGLRGLDRYSHLIVLYWLDRNDTPEKRRTLQVHPRRDPQNPLTGVFATRAPVRPNLIAMSVCRILSIRRNIVEIDDIDAFDGSPVLDLKPYVPRLDAVPEALTPNWPTDA